jgi:hypothetical protein
MDQEKWRSSIGTKCYRVMLFLPLGVYPRGTIRVGNGFFHADDEIVFSVVHGESWREVIEDAPYSEFDWASPQELRLLSSILLSERRDDALVRFYPKVGYSLRIDAEQLDFANDAIVEELRELVLQRINQKNQFGRTVKQTFDRTYHLVEPERFNLERQSEYWKNICIRNFVLLRGIYSLIKAEMLAAHSEFWEEAVIVAYVALEASFTLIRRELEHEGISSPNAYDAARWLYQHFDSPFGLPEPAEKYFEEFYEGRVATLHPSSRFGEFPFAPIMHDDYCHLRRALREVFAYLVSKAHGSDFYEDVERVRGTQNVT